MGLGFLDYSAIGLYLVATLAIGFWVSRRIKSGADFFLAGRSLPFWAVGLSLVATDIGGTDIIGAGGAAYRHGLAVANFEWIGCVPAMILGAFLFIPHFWRNGVSTIPEFLERRFNAAVRLAVALVWVIFMACNLGVMLVASAKMMIEMTTPGGAAGASAWAVQAWIVGTAVVVGLYTISGGLAAVVYTDVMQCVVMIGGCLLIVVIGLYQVGGIDKLRERLAEADAAAAVQNQSAAPNAKDAAAPPEKKGQEPRHGRLSLVLPVDTKSPFPWTGILLGLAFILSPAYWIGNQAIVQRALGAKSEFHAKASYVCGALVKTVIPLITAGPGIIALVLLPRAFQDADHAVPALASAILPAGIRGVFVAGFLAAMMSSVDSYLNAAATIVTHDFYKRFLRQEAGPRNMLVVGRIVSAALIVFGCVFALYLTGVDQGIYGIFQTLMSFFQGPALAVLLCGLLWRRATGKAALCGFLAGMATTISLYVLNLPAVYEPLGWPPLFQISEPYLYFSIWAFLVALATIVTVSLFSRPDPPEKTQFVMGRRTASRQSGDNPNAADKSWSVP